MGPRQQHVRLHLRGRRADGGRQGGALGAAGRDQPGAGRGAGAPGGPPGLPVRERGAHGEGGHRADRPAPGLPPVRGHEPRDGRRQVGPAGGPAEPVHGALRPRLPGPPRPGAGRPAGPEAGDPAPAGGGRRGLLPRRPAPRARPAVRHLEPEPLLQPAEPGTHAAVRPADGAGVRAAAEPPRWGGAGLPHAPGRGVPRRHAGPDPVPPAARRLRRRPPGGAARRTPGAHRPPAVRRLLGGGRAAGGPG